MAPPKLFALFCAILAPSTFFPLFCLLLLFCLSALPSFFWCRKRLKEERDWHGADGATHTKMGLEGDGMMERDNGKTNGVFTEWSHPAGRGERERGSLPACFHIMEALVLAYTHTRLCDSAGTLNHKWLELHPAVCDTVKWTWLCSPCAMKDCQCHTHTQ